MSKTPAEIRFEKSRKKLSTALKDLDETIQRKLHEGAIETKIMDIGNEEDSEVRAKIIEQSETISNLNSEINALQKNLSTLGRESEFLHTKNKIFAEKLAAIRNQQSTLIEEIEADLVRIEDIIKTEE
ncbi:MAG: hypothetical protein V4694_06335 [Pseudomonadota bacterium]